MADRRRSSLARTRAGRRAEDKGRSPDVLISEDAEGRLPEVLAGKEAEGRPLEDLIGEEMSLSARRRKVDRLRPLPEALAGEEAVGRHA